MHSGVVFPVRSCAARILLCGSCAVMRTGRNLCAICAVIVPLKTDVFGRTRTGRTRPVFCRVCQVHLWRTRQTGRDCGQVAGRICGRSTPDVSRLASCFPRITGGNRTRLRPDLCGLVRSWALGRASLLSGSAFSTGTDAGGQRMQSARIAELALRSPACNALRKQSCF